jgi:hypothetical protein
MKNIGKLLLVLFLLVILFTAASCGQKVPDTGLLQGGVNIGPITPVEIPGQNPPVPPEVFSSRKVLIYDESGKNLVQEVNINQINQTAYGFYAVQLEPGNYVLDIKNAGISTAVPRTFTIEAGATLVVDIDIDTGIR